MMRKYLKIILEVLSIMALIGCSIWGGCYYHAILTEEENEQKESDDLETDNTDSERESDQALEKAQTEEQTQTETTQTANADSSDDIVGVYSDENNEIEMTVHQDGSFDVHYQKELEETANIYPNGAIQIADGSGILQKISEDDRYIISDLVVDNKPDTSEIIKGILHEYVDLPIEEDDEIVWYLADSLIPEKIDNEKGMDLLYDSTRELVLIRKSS